MISILHCKFTPWYTLIIHKPNSQKPNSPPGYKVISEKEMHFKIKSCFLQNFFNAKMKEWVNIVIKVALTLNMERWMVMHIIEDIVNDRYSKAQEGMKELETSWEGLTLSS